MTKILLVEDDAAIAEPLSYALKRETWEGDLVPNRATSVGFFEREPSRLHDFGCGLARHGWL